MKVLSCALLAVLACKGKDAESQQPPAVPSKPPVDAAVLPVEAPATMWARCETALRGAPKVPSTRRVQWLIEGCSPCGDWGPLLKWDTEQVHGGPTRLQIEQVMLDCKAYCDPNAKQRFLGTLDAARGKGSRTPFRLLGEICKAEVSAVPDARYVSAPFLALDRIARAVAARPDLAPLLDAFDLPLPAVSSTGSGYALPSAPVTTPEAGPLALTVTAVEMRLAVLPRGKLGKAGITVVTKGDELYPGKLVKSAKELDAEIAKLGVAEPITVFAPSGMAGVRLLDVFPLTARHELRLAVQAEGAPIGWALPGTLPVALVGGWANDKTPAGATKLSLAESPDSAIKQAKAISGTLGRAQITIELAPTATVAGVAKLVGALAFFDVKTVALVRAAKP